MSDTVSGTLAPPVILSSHGNVAKLRPPRHSSHIAGALGQILYSLSAGTPALQTHQPDSKYVYSTKEAAEPQERRSLGS